MTKYLLFALFVLFNLSLINTAPSFQKITNLPGFSGNIPFDQYAGYVNITSNKHMFYWFQESQNDPANDPVLLWTNGGPGCSSMMGALQEHGYFRVNEDNTLSAFPNAWNQIANVIYLEAPVGVGFSYSDDKIDYITGDIPTAEDNYDFLVAWFNLFPEYQKNDFYVTGESYSGHYSTELTYLISLHDKNNTNNFNMKGMLVGNPGINNDWYGSKDEFAFITTLYNHFMIPQAAYLNAVQNCDWQNFLVDCSTDFKHPSLQCREAVVAALKYLPENIDPYNLFAPVCLDNEIAHNNAHQYLKHHPLTHYPELNINFYPCIGNYMQSYLNLPEVQEAFHVYQKVNWQGCGGVLYINETKNMIPVIQYLMANTTYRLNIYSGDVDAAVPTIGTQRWIECLNAPVVNDWHKYEINGQVAGFVIDYDRITFTTVHGCGHMVPYYCPGLRGYQFMENWLLQKSGSF